MFVVSKSSARLDFAALSLEAAPLRTRTYDLDDEGNVLSGRRILEYDLSFDEVPSNLDALLTRCLRAARDSGADVAWFGFEGSFEFAHLLTADIANQIYAVIDSDGVALASDATLPSVAWQERIARARERFAATALRARIRE
jgi:hypothetical protein